MDFTNSKATLPKPSKQRMLISLLFLMYQSIMKSEIHESDTLMLLISMPCILILLKIEIGYMWPSHDLTSVGWSSAYNKEEGLDQFD